MDWSGFTPAEQAAILRAATQAPPQEVVAQGVARTDRFLMARVCRENGCPELVTSAYCRTHARAHEQRRGSRQQRGYGSAHDKLRAEWAPRVATGRIRCRSPHCLRPSDPLIHPGEPWDLGHTPDRRSYRGPEHLTCNRSEGGRAAHR